MAAVVASLAAFAAGLGFPAVPVGFSDDRVARDASDRRLDRADEVVWDIHNLQGASSTARQKLSAVAMGSIPSLAVEVVDGPSVGRRSGGRNRVSFDLSKITTHEITPYAEVWFGIPVVFAVSFVVFSSVGGFSLSLSLLFLFLCPLLSLPSRLVNSTPKS